MKRRAMESLREKLARVPAFMVDAETRRALVEGIAELDEAIAWDAKVEAWVNDARSESPPFDFDLESFTRDLAGFRPMAVLS